ncbi:MAG: hypothetical protein JWN15_2904 [Firmicutes bacterium]|nr:hypothetical protein [Bacillota bacterium]
MEIAMNRWLIALCIVAVATVVDGYAWRWKDDNKRKWLRIPAWFLVLGAIVALIWAG